MKTNLIREKFLNFFKERGHTVFSSDTLVPQSDPTVLFTSAGMNQFKDYFLGIKKDVKRACSCQKCLRTDDLEKVGKTSFHHTFFEMLGNFSFGDYFKEEGILWAWEFVTKVLNLPKEKLWVSVYLEDDQAYQIWKEKVRIPQERIAKLGADKNFWPASAPLKGPNGPCGPCSEIFFDKGPDVGCKRSDCNPGCDCGRFIEIWNLVFTQFNRVDINKLEPLPQKNIDTGMGLERIASVLQQKETNFEIDIIKPLVEFVLKEIDPKYKNLYYVNAITDHLRAVVFAIGDGILPSNEDRGYVVRKLIRRASFFGFLMKIYTPYLYKGVFIVSELMGKVYKEVDEKKEIISQIIKNEEEKFLKNLEKGYQILEEIYEKVKKNSFPIIGAQDCFKLYDTYGLPIEIIKDFADSKSIKVDIEGFEALLTKYREETRKKSKFSKEIFTCESSNFPKTEFCGYQSLITDSSLLIIIKSGQECEMLKEGENGELVLDKTPFYAERGGQIADKGLIKKIEDNAVVSLFEVKDVQYQGESILHKGVLLKGELKIKDKVKCYVDQDKRESIRRAHTCTHILQAVLRKILGLHVKQQGSLVEEDRLRFDFSHFKALSREEIKIIEEEANKIIQQDIPVKIKIFTLEEAKKRGALSFFEEKYESKVRVVEIGEVSKELCGGTHVESTGKIGLFKITNEESIASGVRRIEGICGMRALKKFQSLESLRDQIKDALKTSQDKLTDKIQELIFKTKEYEKKIKDLEILNFSYKAKKLLEEAEQIQGVQFLFLEFQNKSPQILRSYTDTLKNNFSNLVSVIYLKNIEGVNLFVGVTKDLFSKLKANEIVKKVCGYFEGKGGGRQDFAQAGGKKIVDSQILKENIKKEIKDALSQVYK